MKTERITSNRGRYHYNLTPTELIELSPKGYTLQVSEMISARLPQTFSDHCPEITCLCNHNFTPCSFSYYLGGKGRLHIGCREFNKATTKKLLRWAGLL